MSGEKYAGEGNILHGEFASIADRICRDIQFAAFLASEIYGPDHCSLANKRDLNRLNRRIADEMWSLQNPLRLKITIPDTALSYVSKDEEIVTPNPVIYVATDFGGTDSNGMTFYSREEETRLYFSGYQLQIREVFEDEYSQGL